jgi:hypothetical protein
MSHKDSGFYQVQVTSEGTLCLKSGDDGKRWELSPNTFEQLWKDAELPISYDDSWPVELLQHNLAWRYAQKAYRYQMIVDDKDRVIVFAPATFISIPTRRVLETVESALKLCPNKFTPKLVRADNHSYVVYYVATDIVAHTRGGAVHGALELRTSPVGEFTTRICPATFQTICSNGMVTGLRVIPGVAMRETSRNEAAILEAIAEVVPQCCDAALQELQLLQEMETVPVRSLEDMLQVLHARYPRRISADDIRRILEYLDSISYTKKISPIENAFDVIAAVTYAAQRCHFDLRTTSCLEELAGHFLHDIVDGHITSSTTSADVEQAAKKQTVQESIAAREKNTEARVTTSRSYPSQYTRPHTTRSTHRQNDDRLIQ